MSPGGAEVAPSPGSAIFETPLDTLEMMTKEGLDKLPDLEAPEEILCSLVDRG